MLSLVSLLLEVVKFIFGVNVHPLISLSNLAVLYFSTFTLYSKPFYSIIAGRSPD